MLRSDVMMLHLDSIIEKVRNIYQKKRYYSDNIKTCPAFWQKLFRNAPEVVVSGRRRRRRSPSRWRGPGRCPSLGAALRSGTASVLPSRNQLLEIAYNPRIDGYKSLTVYTGCLEAKGFLWASRLDKRKQTKILFFSIIVIFLIKGRCS